ncbi:MAG: hypothetical protein ACREX6_11625, partial [Casimicrobiaceae bacterium]
MSETELLSILNRFKFSKAGEISLANNRLTFNLTNQSNETGLVYLWIEVLEATFVVVYIGKAGRTLRIRCRQHEAGFRRSTTGRAHAERLRKGISKGGRYEVYSRKSGMSDILEEIEIPMECVE